jgi:hypothetical protein
MKGDDIPKLQDAMDVRVIASSGNLIYARLDSKQRRE